LYREFEQQFKICTATLESIVTLTLYLGRNVQKQLIQDAETELQSISKRAGGNRQQRLELFRHVYVENRVSKNTRHLVKEKIELIEYDVGQELLKALSARPLSEVRVRVQYMFSAIRAHIYILAFC